MRWQRKHRSGTTRTEAQLTAAGWGSRPNVRRLLAEAEAHIYRHGLCLDRTNLDCRVGEEYASRAISELFAAKQRGWTNA